MAHLCMNYKRELLSLLYVIHCFIAPAQDLSKIKLHEVFLTGNVSGISKEKLFFVEEKILQSKSPSTLIINGDILYKEGLTGTPTKHDSDFVNLLISIAHTKPDHKNYFTPGDEDWNNSGREGLNSVIILENLINEIAGRKAFIPGSGCPGPYVISISDYLDIAFINSQWLIHPYSKPYAPDDDCKSQTEAQFQEELEEVITETKNKNLLLIGHHPVWSNGQYGGRTTFKDHFNPPLAGTFKAAFHKNIGLPADMSYPAYRNFTKKMRYMMEIGPPFIYASAHEFNQQVIEQDNSFQVISGSLNKSVPTGSSKSTLFKSNKTGFLKITYYSNGEVAVTSYELNNTGSIDSTEIIIFHSACTDTVIQPANTRYIPCKVKQSYSNEDSSTLNISSGNIVAGEEYKAGPIKKVWMGKLYRTSWTAQVRLPYLDLDKEKGGLIPTGTGGGRQTKSLSLTGGDGNNYVFRSINKDPVKALKPALRSTFIGGLIKEFTATQHPYGALPVKQLLDATDILHANPELYILPDNKQLGIFQKDFANMPGFLEEKPSKEDENMLGTFNANYVVRSQKLFLELNKTHKNKVNEKAFLKARVVDMLIGDWGRHEDNWKWAGYTEGTETIYYPIPRDRDHAFSQWNGIFPWLVSRKWALPNAENFDYRFKDIRSLNYPARYLDNFLLSSLSSEEWKNIAIEIQNAITDSVIDSAIRQFPKEIIPLSGNIIGEKLKSRRKELPDAVMKYYKLLSQEVNITGSNKVEQFEINSLTHDSIQVIIIAEDRIIYKRIFASSETKYINIYGLGGNDEFDLNELHKSKTRIRIFGGKGNDMYIDSTETRTGNKVNIYEYKFEQSNKFMIGNNYPVKFSDNRGSIDFQPRPDKKDSYSPLPFLHYTNEDAFEYGIGLFYLVHRHGENHYTNKLTFNNRFSVNGNVYLKIIDEFHHLFGTIDLILEGEIGQPYLPVYFYGEGNETKKQNDVPEDFYQSRKEGYAAFAGLQKTFFRKSSILTGMKYEKADVTQLNETNFSEEAQNINRSYYGPAAKLDIDFRSANIYPKEGARFVAEYSMLFSNESNTGKIENTRLLLEFYQSSKTILPLTIGMNTGFNHSSGDVPYYKLNTLGRTTGLRGFTRDRFSGKSAAFVNFQLAMEFGTFKNDFLPLTYGLFVFSDNGKVWKKNENSKIIHNGYGCGMYFIPLVDILTTSISVSFSEEAKNGIFEFGMGVEF